MLLPTTPSAAFNMIARTQRNPYLQIFSTLNSVWFLRNMEFHNRRLLLLNEDAPISTSKSPLPLLQDTEPTATNNNSSSPPESMTSSSSPPSSSMFGRPLQLTPRPIFTSNVAYAFLILFTALFFLGFILLYIRQLSSDSVTADSSRHRRRRRRSHPSCEGLDPTAAKSLPAFSYRGDEKQPLDCAICLDELRGGETVKMIPYCKHVFHPECIDTWLAAHVTCPICRCTKLCDVGRRGIMDDGAGSTAENGEEGREVASGSQSLGDRRRTSSGSRFGLGDTVALRRTLSY